MEVFLNLIWGFFHKLNQSHFDSHISSCLLAAAVLLVVVYVDVAAAQAIHQAEDTLPAPPLFQPTLLFLSMIHIISWPQITITILKKLWWVDISGSVFWTTLKLTQKSGFKILRGKTPFSRNCNTLHQINESFSNTRAKNYISDLSQIDNCLWRHLVTKFVTQWLNHLGEGPRSGELYWQWTNESDMVP